MSTNFTQSDCELTTPPRSKMYPCPSPLSAVRSNVNIETLSLQLKHKNSQWVQDIINGPQLIVVPERTQVFEWYPATDKNNSLGGVLYNYSRPLPPVFGSRRYIFLLCVHLANCTFFPTLSCSKWETLSRPKSRTDDISLNQRSASWETSIKARPDSMHQSMDAK